MSSVALASGYQLPLVGFGLWKIPRDVCAEVVYNAIKAGYRQFDGAYDYQNEKEAGEGIKRAIAEGLVKREDIFITTKLWNMYHEKDRALEMGRKQNESWGLGYIDLYLIHFPIAQKWIDPAEIEFPAWWSDNAKSITQDVAKVPMRETWEALEQLVDEKVVRSIGVSNCQTQTLMDISTYNKHPISSLQIEHHPYLVQDELVRFAQGKKIVVTAYSSYGPQSFLEMPDRFKKSAVSISTLFEQAAIKTIAAAHGKTPAQVLLRWATQRGIAVIPKSTNAARLAENLQSTDFDLSTAEIAAISALDIGLRFNDPNMYLETKDICFFA